MDGWVGRWMGKSMDANTHGYTRTTKCTRVKIHTDQKYTRDTHAARKIHTDTHGYTRIHTDEVTHGARKYTRTEIHTEYTRKSHPSAAKRKIHTEIQTDTHG